MDRIAAATLSLIPDSCVPTVADLQSERGKMPSRGTNGDIMCDREFHVRAVLRQKPGACCDDEQNGRHRSKAF